MENTERTSLLITDATLDNVGTPSAFPLHGRTALLNLAVVLRQYGMVVDLETDETGTTHTLTICHPDCIVLNERAPKGRPRKSEKWPKGLDTPQQRLEWLDSVTADEAAKTLGISRATLYRRIEALRASI